MIPSLIGRSKWRNYRTRTLSMQPFSDCRSCREQLQPACSSILPRPDDERKREEWGTEVEHVAGITGPRRRCKADYKGVKSIKITMYFSSRRCVPGGIPVLQMRQAGGKGTKDEEVECDAK